ncbi:MAG: glycosyl transferase family protein [Methylovulum sp.]|uniref:glycosyl transferase family protein n=1 Tax=Methylovulum sp. TaxID=1916980 RepID=UPI00261D9783|nr:glycosyl transferase family protein [Methylovulum sp.]MDD2724314.1 glycosyl transferase family protein [Methylovulum sp.]MDD5122953.1 glycosyl transferase family protein [Methylovulum sp.]
MTFTHHEETPYSEHPFAEIVRILGKGKKGSRPLTQEEAYRAMKMILADEVLPVQLGAFLMLMRVKEETAEELAGFVQAAMESFMESFQIDDEGLVDLDWSSYAGKRRHLPWFLLSALLLAENGITVFMHGASGHSAGRLYTENMLGYLGLACAHSVEEARQQLEQQHFSYLSLEHFCPKLNEIIELRPILGLRSPVHTLVRMLNPFKAPYSIQGIFHPSYRAVHQHAALLLEQPHMAVLKGEGGETERNPDMECLVQSVHHGKLSDENWPALFTRRHIKPDELNPERLSQLWRGDYIDEFAMASVIGTTAIALNLLEITDDQQQAYDIAMGYWQSRDRNKFSRK